MSASRNHSPRIEQERAPKFVFECVTAHIYAASSTDADFIDFSIYVDARTDDIQQWFLARLRALRDTAFTDPRSPFRQLAEVSLAEVDAFGAEVWKTINEVNLVENIQPTRARATLVLHKDADHAVTRVGLRRF